MDKFKCKICGKEYESKQKLGGHVSGHKRKKLKKTKRIRTLNPLKNCRYCNKEFNNGRQVAGHENMCLKNPKRNSIIEKNRNSQIGRKHSDITKELLSNKQKIAHAEGRAWNIGKSRWNNKPSYPEIFFKKVIENEFINKNYKSEYPVGIYSIDFAWPEIKKAIEIDGEQHYRFKEYIERDKRKDLMLKNEGWEFIRIRWKEMFNDTKNQIKIAKDFIDKK